VQKHVAATQQLEILVGTEFLAPCYYHLIAELLHFISEAQPPLFRNQPRKTSSTSAVEAPQTLQFIGVCSHFANKAIRSRGDGQV